LCDFYHSDNRNNYEPKHNCLQEFRILLGDAPPESPDPKSAIARLHLLLYSSRKILQILEIKNR
jgi:hypothetical protein